LTATKTWREKRVMANFKTKKVGSRTSKEVLPEDVPLSAPSGLPECIHHV
jgi:hypothetical protein